MNPVNDLPALPAKGVLEDVEAEQKKFAAQARDQDEELKGKRREHEKAEKKALARVEEIAERAERARAEYLDLEPKIQAEEAQAITAKGARREDVEAGRLSMADYLAATKKAEEVEQEARARTREQLKDLLGSVRRLKLEQTRAEFELLDVRLNLYYLSSAPLLFFTDRLKELLAVAERKSAGVLAGWPVCQAAREERKKMIEFAEGREAMRVEIFRDLTPEQVRDLRFNPIIREEFLPQLEEIISSLQPDATISIRYTAGGPKKGLECW